MTDDIPPVATATNTKLPDDSVSPETTTPDASRRDTTQHDMSSPVGVATHVIERILNHTSGTFAGVAGVYNRFDYFDEMRAALEVWERHVISIVADDAASQSASTGT